MENISQYIGVTLILGVFVWGMIGFYRGLSLTNWFEPPELGEF